MSMPDEDDHDALYYDVHAASEVMGQEVAIPQPRRRTDTRRIKSMGQVGAIEQGTRYPDGSEYYERVEFK